MKNHKPEVLSCKAQTTCHEIIPGCIERPHTYCHLIYLMQVRLQWCQKLILMQ